jgi:hypothetical protein
MSNKQNSRAAFSLLTGWILVNLIGWAAGLAISVLFYPVAARIPIPWQHDGDMVSSYATIIFLGFTVGIAQWTVMRRHLARPARWITATLIGYLLCLVIFVIASNSPVRLERTKVWNNALLLGLMGSAIGVSQWWVLRQHYSKAGLWVLASAVGFLFFMWGIITPSHSQGEFIIRSTISGVLAAAVSGVTLVWLVKKLSD